MTGKIMVVEDNAATRRMVRNALARNGHEVIEAPDGATALTLMRTEQPSLVLQDLMLPDADGFELVGQLRRLARGTDVSILAFSGFVSELDEARISTVGFDDIIAKPIAPSRLVPLIEAHLPGPAPANAQFGAGRRLVIADDDPMQLKLATFRLTRLGFAVEAVSDGRAALDAVRSHAPDVVISDVMMPELDGFGLAMAVRQDPALKSVPVLLMTSSYVDPADRALARRAGANDLVPRTPELAELLESLRSTMTSKADAPQLDDGTLDDLEKEHGRRVFRQLERQVMLNTGLAKRCSVLASELSVLAGISEAVLNQRNADAALDESLAACFDAGGIAQGALYLLEPNGELRVRQLGTGSEPTAVTAFFGHESLLRDLIATARTLHLPSGGLARDLENELLARAQASAMLIVPLTSTDTQLGCLVMIARGREMERDDWRAFGHGIATQVTHVLTLARAYEERENAERQATEHAALLDAMITSAPDYVAHLELDGTIRLMNRPLFDIANNGVVGGNIFNYPAGDHSMMLRKALAQIDQTGEPQGFEAAVFRPDGSQVWYSTRLGPVKKDGKVTGAVMVSRDVSDKKQTEMHLMLSDRMASVGTLAAGVAHEINNPLASVIANLDMAMQDITALAETAKLPPDLSDELKDARVAADRVREIVRDLKIFSRGEEDRHGPVDVEHVLESTLRMAWNELRHRAKLVKKYTKVPYVDAHESRLGQVFLNLIINAAHAIPPGNYDANEIRISTSVDGGRVVVSIADTGTGIPVEVRPRLFTPFFSTKPVGVGTGLGLAISHRIVTQFNGTITYDTEVGKGTEFHISLPISGGEKTEKNTQKIWTRAPAARRGNVLVIDDEETLAQAIRRFLSVEHNVTAVYRARDALDLLEAGTRYDVILCDLMMPQITGMELHGEIQRIDQAQAAKVVFLTGGAFTPYAREFLMGTSNRRIEKPFDLKEVRRLVNDLIR